MKEFRQAVITPALVVGLAALFLSIMNHVPRYLPGSVPAATEYSSVEEASLGLGFNIAIPVYFPNYLAWPPETIKGQKKPVPKVEIVFLSADRRTEILAIYQWLSDKTDSLSPLPWIETVSTQMPVRLSHSNGELIIGRMADGSMANGVHWIKNGRHFFVITTQSVQELLAIARSMSR